MKAGEMRAELDDRIRKAGTGEWIALPRHLADELCEALLLLLFLLRKGK